MIERRKALTVLLTVGFIPYASACERLGLYDWQLSASLRTDSTQIGAHKSGYGYFARIGFLYANTTSQPVAMAGCGPHFPEVQKKVDGRWVVAYYAAHPACLIKPDFTIPSHGSFHGVLDFAADEPGHHIGPELSVDSIDGIYRLEWDFVQGTDASARGARRVKATSNEFRMTLVQQ